MDFNLNKLSENLTNITNPLTEGPSITTFATILPSFTGLQGWLTLFLIYCVFETCRKVAFQAWGTVLASFWITIDLTQGNRSYGEYLLAAPASTAAAMSPPPGADYTFHL